MPDLVSSAPLSPEARYVNTGSAKQPLFQEGDKQ